MMTQSTGEEAFIIQARAIGGLLRQYEREYRFAPPRRWRFDFAWPELMVALEVEGGVFQAKSRHTSGTGFTADCEKYSEAALGGWAVIRATTQQIVSGVGVTWVEKALNNKQGK